ncbi:uncharacterized protein LOC123258275 [Drosophila ananassae]|uniref:uncharacterized protein LOC123258275 n=1 Tax=Drosophila ananassae TaxID=7217 RepID=UPI001CFFF49D|nr:uncharacterized protein LOC123258275 [Drosophila ananassae]
MLSLKRHDTKLRIEGIGGQPRMSRARVTILVSSLHGDFSQRIEAFVLPHIIADQPAQPLTHCALKIPNECPLADPQFDKPGRIDLLIGTEHYYSLLLPNQQKVGRDGAMLQNTKLGWIVAGRVKSKTQSAIACGVGVGEETDALIERFWKLDNLENQTKHRSPSEAHCEKHFIETLKRAEDGRFIVKLPFAEHPSALGESKEIAIKRFLALERRLTGDVRKGYSEFMKEYEALEHMKFVPTTHVPNNHYFIPHHCVLKPDSSSTKLRVVFDASCKTSSGKSLNDILHTGPTVQSELMAILLRFRIHKYVFTADIEKMYRQVWINPDNQFHQLIVWRNDPSEDLKYYRLKTVTYGTKTAPFLATKCLNHLAIRSRDNYPLGSAALENDFYVDDCLTGADSVAEAVQIQSELNKILLPHGFKLRKWCSNNAELLQGIPKEDTVSDVKLGETLDQYSVKTLGLIWMPNKDKLCG